MRRLEKSGILPSPSRDKERGVALTRDNLSLLINFYVKPLD